MAGRGDRNRDSGIGNQTLDNPEEQDPALSDVGEDEDEAELVGLAGPDLPGLDEQLGLDPAAPRIRPLPPLPPQPSPPPSPQPSPPTPQPQHQPQPPIMAAQANRNQIALLPTFDGEAGSDVDMWIAVFLPMARQFNWIDAVITPNQDTRLASVAKNKLLGKAAFWLDTERRGAETDIWDTIVQNLAAVPARPHTCIGLKDGLISIYKVDISQLEATEAVMDLVMKSNETINVFLRPSQVGNGGKEPLHQHGGQGPGSVHRAQRPGPFYILPGGSTLQIPGIRHVWGKSTHGPDYPPKTLCPAGSYAV
jgi:hypothetical protein